VRAARTESGQPDSTPTGERVASAHVPEHAWRVAVGGDGSGSDPLWLRARCCCCDGQPDLKIQFFVT